MTLFSRTAALAAAAATALTLGSTAPVQAADNDELARILFGALALGIVAHSINNNDNHSDDRWHRPHTQPTYRHPPRQNGPRDVTVGRPGGRFAVPAQCQRRLNTQHGVRTFVAQPCLQGAGYNTAQLPRECRRTLDFDRRDVNGWGVSCLAKNGYRMR